MALLPTTRRGSTEALEAAPFAAAAVGDCWLALELWRQLELDEFWAERLLPSRKGTRWDQVLLILVAYCLLSPGSEWRLHREWYQRSARCAVRPQSSSMGIDDGAAYRESNPHSAVLGGVEGLENPLAILRSDAASRVAYRDEQALRRARFGADHQFPHFIIDGDHGLDRVEDQIQHDLLQLHSIPTPEPRPPSAAFREGPARGNLIPASSV